MNSSVVKWIFPFICGILLEGVFEIKHALIPMIFCVLCIAAFIVCLRFTYRHKLTRIVCTALIVAISATFGYSLALLESPLRSQYHYSHYISDADMYKVVVDNMPTHTDKYVKATAKINMAHLPEGWEVVNGKAILYFTIDSTSKTLRYGDVLLLKTKLRDINTPKNPYEFDYKKYLSQKKIYGNAYITDQYSIIEKSNRNDIKSTVYKLRQGMMDIINSTSLTTQEKAIAEAMLLGWDENLDDDTILKFSNAGISHLLCVSGLHLGIIATMVGWCLFFIGNSKKHRIIKGCIQIIILWIFAGITGLAPSASRAASMFSLVVIGEMFLSRANIYNNLATSALILLVADPYLIYDIGFQLSYFAVIGIVSIQPTLYNLFSFSNKDWIKAYYNKNGKPSNIVDALLYAWQWISNATLWLLSKIWNFATISIAAQLAVTPFLLYYFNQFPIYFLIANILIVPFVGIILATTIAMLMFYNIGIIGQIFEYLFSKEITFIDLITSFTSNLPYVSIKGICFDEFMFGLGIISIVAFVLWIGRKWKYYLYTALLSLSVIVLYGAYIKISTSSQSKWTVYDTSKGLAMEVMSGNESWFIADSALLADSKQVKYFTDNYRTRHCIYKTNNISLDDTLHNDIIYKNKLFVAFGNHRIGIITQSINNHNSQKLHLSHIIVTHNAEVSISELCNNFDFDTLIISSDNYHRKAKRWIDECKALGIPYHYTAQDGAYIGKQ